MGEPSPLAPTEFERAEEETVGRAAPRARVMHAMRGRDVVQEAEARERAGTGQTTVNEAVVHDRVRDPERRRADTHAEHHLSRDPGARLAPVEDAGDRERRVQRAEHVVGFEATGTTSMMGRVDAPEPSVPHAPVQERRPEIHRHRDDDRDREPNQHRHGAPP